MATQQKGIVIADFSTDTSNSNDSAQSVVVQDDGKILVAGYSNGDFALIRYNGNGSLDNTFDDDGKVVTTIGSSIDFGYSSTLQADGKILVAGTSWNGNNYDFALVRYNSNGSTDITFGNDGKVITAIDSTSDDRGYSVTVQSDGKILVTGSSFSNKADYPYIDANFALVRYNSDGALDTSFDSDGKLTTAIPGGYAQSVTIQADGKILVAGYSTIDVYPNFSLVRYNIDGSLDTSFDNDGKLTTITGNASYGKGYSVIVQSDGKIVVAGETVNDNSVDFALVRYNSDGSLDSTFDEDGKVTTPIGSSSYDEGFSTTLQSDGKILLAGLSSNGSRDDFALVRYNIDGSLDNAFDGDGKVTTAIIGSLSAVGYSVTQQADGKVLVAGYSHNGINEDFALVRYNSDGSLDNTFDGGVIPNNLPTGTLSINDTTPEQNQLLTASNALADADGLGTISYTWKTGSTVLGTGNTYTVTANELGKSIQVTASYTDGLGNSESVSSNPTALVTVNHLIPIELYGDIGGNKADVLVGLSGDDRLYGLNMSDDLSGNAGNDTLYGGYGNDSLHGGDGNDKLLGESDNDYLDGGNGNDTLNGAAGNDSFNGGLGRDILSGGVGNDTLTGGAGKDNLTGGIGADKFKFAAVSESGITATTRDTITDFKIAQSDKIDLSAIDANTAVTGNDGFATLNQGATFSGSFSVSAALFFDQTTHILWGNNDADATADFSILLTGVTTLSTSDFIL